VEDFIIPVTSLTAAEGTGAVYVSYTREEPSAYASGSFSCTLRFVSKEVDPSTGEPEDEGYPDEYQIEDVDLGAADVSPCSFRRFITIVIQPELTSSTFPQPT
jgi:coatomer protein complex subunit gamma